MRLAVYPYIYRVSSVLGAFSWAAMWILPLRIDLWTEIAPSRLLRGGANCCSVYFLVRLVTFG